MHSLFGHATIPLDTSLVVDVQKGKISRKDVCFHIWMLKAKHFRFEFWPTKWCCSSSFWDILVCSSRAASLLTRLHNTKFRICLKTPQFWTGPTSCLILEWGQLDIACSLARSEQASLLPPGPSRDVNRKYSSAKICSHYLENHKR